MDETLAKFIPANPWRARPLILRLVSLASFDRAELWFEVAKERKQLARISLKAKKKCGFRPGRLWRSHPPLHSNKGATPSSPLRIRPGLLRASGHDALRLNGTLPNYSSLHRKRRFCSIL